MSDYDVAETIRENDRLADLDDAINDKSAELYFDALNDLALRGRLFNDDQQYELDDELWAGHEGGINATEVNKLVGAYHQVISLDTAGRLRADAALGRYIRELYEEKLLMIVDAAAVRECSR